MSIKLPPGDTSALAGAAGSTGMENSESLGLVCSEQGQQLRPDRDEVPVSAAPPRCEDWGGGDNKQGTQLREDTKAGCHYYYFLLFAMTLM